MGEGEAAEKLSCGGLCIGARVPELAEKTAGFPARARHDILINKFLNPSN